MIKISQSTIERAAWWLVLVILLVNIAFVALVYVKIKTDDARKFHVLDANQKALICVVKGFTQPQHSGAFIDTCVKENQ